MAKARSAEQLESALAQTIPAGGSELYKRFQQILKRNAEVTIIGTASYEKACAAVLAIKDLKEEFQSQFKVPVDAAHKAHKAICDLRNKFVKPLAEAEGRLRIELARFALQRQDEARIEQAQAHKQTAEAAADRRDRLAAALDEAGEGDAADVARTVPLATAPHYVEPVPEVDGVSYAVSWHAEVVDVGQVPRDFMMPDQKKLDDYAHAMKAQASVPGVRFYKKLSPRLG